MALKLLSPAQTPDSYIKLLPPPPVSCPSLPTLASSPFLKHYRQAPTSGPLLLISSKKTNALKTFPLNICIACFTSFKCFLNCSFLNGAFGYPCHHI